MKNLNSKLILLATFLLGLSSVALLRGQTRETPSVEVGVNLEPAIELGLTEGKNQFGRQTRLLGNAIDFGVVSFTHPEQIANGDAYLEGGHLNLEAVINVQIRFNSVSSVAVDLTKLGASSNPFHKVSYSRSLQRSAITEEIFSDPRRNQVALLTQPEDFSIRMVLELTPQQTGRISDRFRLEARGL